MVVFLVLVDRSSLKPIGIALGWGWVRRTALTYAVRVVGDTLAVKRLIEQIFGILHS